MDIDALRQQIATMRQSLIDERILDEQILLVGNILPTYFIETATVVYFDNSPTYIEIIEQALEQETPFDLPKLENFLNKLKNCTRFFAEKVPMEVDKVLERCRANDKEGSKAAFQRFKDQYNILKDRVEAYLELLHKAHIADLFDPPSTTGGENQNNTGTTASGGRTDPF